MNHAERSTLPGVTLCGAVIAERGELPRAYQVTRDAIVGRYDAGNVCWSCAREYVDLSK